jgi:cytochrome b6-f complex iron-sulfur subunit
MTERGSMERRTFIRRYLSKILLGICALPFGYAFFSFMTFKKKRERQIRFPPEEQTAGVTFKEGVFLIRGDAGWYALSARCAHLGCTLNNDPASRQFRCPCHGSVFDLKGRRLAGPAKKNLTEIPLTEDADKTLVATLKL